MSISPGDRDSCGHVLAAGNSLNWWARSRSATTSFEIDEIHRIRIAHDYRDHARGKPYDNIPGRKVRPPDRQLIGPAGKLFARAHRLGDKLGALPCLCAAILSRSGLQAWLAEEQHLGVPMIAPDSNRPYLTSREVIASGIARTDWRGP